MAVLTAKVGFVCVLQWPGMLFQSETGARFRAARRARIFGHINLHRGKSEYNARRFH